LHETVDAPIEAVAAVFVNGPRAESDEFRAQAEMRPRRDGHL
jgi:hypothetical protein